jgi:hypothetical protein
MLDPDANPVQKPGLHSKKVPIHWIRVRSGLWIHYRRSL